MHSHLWTISKRQSIKRRISLPLCPKSRFKVLLKKEDGVSCEFLSPELLSLDFGSPFSTNSYLLPTSLFCWFFCKDLQMKGCLTEVIQCSHHLWTKGEFSFWKSALGAVDTTGQISVIYTQFNHAEMSESQCFAFCCSLLSHHQESSLSLMGSEFRGRMADKDSLLFYGAAKGPPNYTEEKLDRRSMPECFTPKQIPIKFNMDNKCFLYLWLYLISKSVLLFLLICIFFWSLSFSWYTSSYLVLFNNKLSTRAKSSIRGRKENQDLLKV